jgi:uncharacterized protein (TIGR04255 family)
MPFPMVERVIYNKNPLDSVICQLRFPPILRIETDILSKFQEVVFDWFPIYQENTEFQQEISAGIDIQFPDRIMNPISKVTSNKNHSFVSVDGNWTINLTRTFISIKTTKYIRWEDFWSKFEMPLDFFIKEYKPPFFTRLGLRYIDVFCRSGLGLDGIEWRDLINTPYLGLLSSGIEDVRKNVRESRNINEIKLEDDISRLKITTALVRSIDQEECFLVDSDFYTPRRVTVNEINQAIIFLHERSTRLIRNVIKDRLHYAMEPEIVK